MDNSASNAGRDWNAEVLDSPCPPWCTLTPAEHPFELNDVNDLERIHETDIESFVSAAAKYTSEHVYASITERAVVRSPVARAVVRSVLGGL